MVYCTLFGANYADKGIVMLKSLIKNDRDAKVYVLAMDMLCYNILRSFNFSRVVIIKLDEFEDDELLSVKGKRSFGEYCWSCTAKLIHYILFYYKEYQCTYVDADLYFYSNPNVLFLEMQKDKCSVQTTRHRFTNTKFGRYLAKKHGENCVQFVTFTKERNSIYLLNEWIDMCYKECNVSSGGDQRYTDAWSDKPFVNVSCNGGAGVAPWNINRYRLIEKKENLLYDRFDKCCYKLIFYHFQNVVFVKRDIVRLNVLQEHWFIDKRLFLVLYNNYIRKLQHEQKIIEEKFGVCPIANRYISDVTAGKRKCIWRRIVSFIRLPVFEKYILVCNRVLSVIRGGKIFYTIKDGKKK